MKTKNLKSPKKDGFSIVEVLFAVFFLSVIVFGTVRLQISNLVLASARNSELNAHFLANQGLEIMEALGKGQITCPTCFCLITKTPPFYSLTCPGGSETLDNFTRTIDVDNSGLTDAWKVVSSVSWQDNTGDHIVEAKKILYE